MRHVVFLKSSDGDTMALSGFDADVISGYRGKRELLLLLGPYAPLVGQGKWVGSRVTAGMISENRPLQKQWQYASSPSPSLALLEEIQRQLVSKLSDFHAICNFTRGEYLFSPEPFVNWLDNPLGLGLQLFRLLTTPDTSLAWSGYEIAITPLVFPWMRNVTEEVSAFLMASEERYIH